MSSIRHPFHHLLDSLLNAEARKIKTAFSNLFGFRFLDLIQIQVIICTHKTPKDRNEMEAIRQILLLFHLANVHIEAFAILYNTSMVAPQFNNWLQESRDRVATPILPGVGCSRYNVVLETRAKINFFSSQSCPEYRSVECVVS